MNVINKVPENLEVRSAVIYNARRINLDPFQIFRVTRSVSRTRLKKERCLQMPYGLIENR